MDGLHFSGEEARTITGILPQADVSSPISFQVLMEMPVVIRDRGITRQGQLIVFDNSP